MVAPKVELPHDTPAVTNTFASSYDLTYIASGGAPPKSAPAKASGPAPPPGGHTVNRPMYQAPPRSFENTLTTNKAATMLPPAEPWNPHAAMRSERHTTAQQRTGGAINPQPSSEFISTTRATYTRKEADHSNPSRTRTLYGGSLSTQHRPDFFAIPDPGDNSPKRSSALPPAVQPRAPANIRDGLHVNPKPANPMIIAPLDRLAEQQLKVKDPVAYHAYKNQRPWVTQSSLIGEFLREPRAARVPERMASPDKHAAVRSLSKNKGIAAAHDITFYPGGSGSYDTTSKATFVPPSTLPEPDVAKAPKPRDHPYQSKWPTDTSNREAVDSVRALDGTLVASRPDKVHPTVWKLMQSREKAMTMTDPHAHKRHAPAH